MSHYPNAHSQRGVALMVALVFLLATTLIALSATRSSRLELRMAQNEEARLTAVQQAQAVAEAVVGSPTAIPVIGTAGYLICTPGEQGCDSNDLQLPDSFDADVAADVLNARVQLLTGLDIPPPRTLGSSMDKFSVAHYRVNATYDRSDESLGRANLSEGVLILIPKP
jgi:hypothetical protein